MNKKMLTTIEKRQAKMKADVLEHLSKVPIVQIVCEKAGISRATYYRWIEESDTFSAEVAKAIAVGTDRISDLAESKIVSAINNDNLTASIFFLKHRNPKYKPTVKTELTIPEYEMSEEEKEKLRQIVRINSRYCKNCEKEWKEQDKQFRKEGKLIN